MSGWPFEQRDRCVLIGMVHLQPLPGSSRWGGSLELVLAAALRDAETLIEGGCDGVVVENMHDTPYLRGHVYPETTAAMAVITAQIGALGSPTGVQVLAAANREALGVAVAAGADFIRVEGYAYAHVADEGWIDACAAELLRARAGLQSTVAIWADVQKKHAAHAVTADLSIADLAKGAVFNGADAVVITGQSTGEATNPAHLSEARAAGVPVVVGSGVTERNVAAMCGVAEALIVGSSLKREGNWRFPVDLMRVRRLRAALDEANLQRAT